PCLARGAGLFFAASARPIVPFSGEKRWISLISEHAFVILARLLSMYSKNLHLFTLLLLTIWAKNNKIDT
ncbi:MAG: hypothetical protein RR065_11095, partial [Clostridia bacterium]